MNILLLAINRKNTHKAIAPYYLASTIRSKLGSKVDVLETNINVPIMNIISGILDYAPDVIGLSCYIWNIDDVIKICTLLKEYRPDIKIILGGPEVADKAEYQFSDCVIVGAGEDAICYCLSRWEKGLEVDKVLSMPHDFSQGISPFDQYYFDSFVRDNIPSIANRLVYYESSRGCPFSCTYCLSSVQESVQFLPLCRVFSELALLVDKGAKIIKFVDRTFNADKKRANEILSFISQLNCNTTFHFEVGGDLFDEEMYRILASMPKGRVQFEIGIQSINPQTLVAIDRVTNIEKLLANITRLVGLGNCIVYVDLLAGLPFETFDSFLSAINSATLCRPYSVSVGFVKMLKSTKLREQANSYSKYLPFAPYEVIKTDTISRDEMTTLRLYDNVIDKYYNSQSFYRTMQLAITALGSMSNFLDKFCKHTGAVNFKISNKNAFGLLYDFLIEYIDKEQLEHSIKQDVLAFDPNGILPNGMKFSRNKNLEMQYKGKYTYFRIEHYDFDNSDDLYDYTTKDIIS